MSSDTAFMPLKGRPAPLPGARVRVYRNLNLFEQQVFSILAMDGELKGKVLGYCKVVGLEDVTFKVSEKTRQKVVFERCRTVHSYAEGYVKELRNDLPHHCASGPTFRITYNPFLAGHFYDRQSPDRPVLFAAEVWTSGADLIVPG